MRKAIIWAVLTGAVLIGSHDATTIGLVAPGSAASPVPVLQLLPPEVAPGSTVTLKVATDCKDSATIDFTIDGGGFDDDTTGFCAVNAYTGQMTAPTTPGTYVARAAGLNLSLKAYLTVLPSSGGSVCEQAIAEAGTGTGAFGEYELVFAPAPGGAGSQVVVGTDGDDRLIGGSGSDLLCGGDGDDILTGGSGHDAMYGEGGDDQLTAGSGDDSLDGGVGTDALSGGSGDDLLLGGERVLEGSGDDLTVAP